jgi:hypothetical protein
MVLRMVGPFSDPFPSVDDSMALLSPDRSAHQESGHIASFDPVANSSGCRRKTRHIRIDPARQGSDSCTPVFIISREMDDFCTAAAPTKGGVG